MASSQSSETDLALSNGAPLLFTGQLRPYQIDGLVWLNVSLPVPFIVVSHYQCVSQSVCQCVSQSVCQCVSELALVSQCDCKCM